jgi:hypothetical protein
MPLGSESSSPECRSILASGKELDLIGQNWS